MDIVCIRGSVPGPVVVTVAHGADVRQVPMEVARHPAGGWRARAPGGTFGLRCHTVNAAVLLEAAEAYAAPDVSRKAA
jgi:hypothetical protein